MPNYFYSDANGQKQGPLTSQQLQTLIDRGIIEPTTPLTTDTGHTGLAGQIRGLFNALPQSLVPPAPQAANQPVQQNVSVPVADWGKSSRLITIVVILALIVVVGIGWSVYPRNTVKRNEINIFDKRNIDGTKRNVDTDEARRVAEAIRKGFGVPNASGGSSANGSHAPFTAAEQGNSATPSVPIELTTTLPQTQHQNDVAPSQPPQQPDSPEKSLLQRKIDLVIEEHYGKPNFSDESKAAIVEYLIRAEKALGRNYNKDELHKLITGLYFYTGQGNNSLHPLLTLPFGAGIVPYYKSVDIYLVNLADYMTTRGLITSSYHGTVGVDKTVNIVREDAMRESWLPESNRLSGNAHDNIEQARVRARERATESRQLFGQ